MLQVRILKTFCCVGVVLVFCGVPVYGQVGSLCRPNERFLTCGGCQKTCKDPSPACASVCRVGCYCPEGLVRGENGVCVELSECPHLGRSDYREDTSEPILDRTCPEKEEYRFCEPCGNRTCDNPDPVCPAQCARGCFCREGLVRDETGACIELQKCQQNSNAVKREIIAKCRANEEFKDCQNCEKTCSNPNPVCPAQCQRGCFCKDGYYKSPSGDCVPLENCPKDECDDINAEYTCRYPCEELCSQKPCSIRAVRCSLGCFCKLGFIKEDTTGKCVRPNECSTPKNVYSKSYYL